MAPVRSTDPGWNCRIRNKLEARISNTQEQQSRTSGIVESRLGKLSDDGYPRGDVQKIFDDIDFERACQAYLWALPVMAMHSGRQKTATVRAGNRIVIT